ncbi:hypothetical protein ACEQ6A_09090 [Rhizobium brockwellii]|uniref:hypothetical protein n=1 Tax=Rhizobium TaxID=379 RepID=UPI001031160A|nr:hypothetical protein [Rhizobium leguminosarum]TAU81833.1 hypothetical protein ELI40_00250 [Rhizobium leguminosarum]TAX08047.1 hypothetical protein ELI07_00250 [Rhizobium leguminosarum]TAY10291.1 hypothetical protein ELH96_00250 [Rhizobium leguminosarum]TAZ12625.1 hypothetical protein ELH81_00250 [Rhizobium leguminosarum]
MIELSIETSSAGTGFGMTPIDPVKWGAAARTNATFQCFSVLLLVAEKIPYWQANVIMRNEL